MIRWIRRIVPIEFLAIFAGLYALAEGLDRFVQIFMRDFNIEPLTNARQAVLLMGCNVYGVYRAWAFHPAMRTEYRKWLIRTPWTRGKALPIGPVYLVWQDAFFVGLAVLLASYLGSPHAYWPAVTIVLGYVLTLTSSFSDRRLRPFMYVVVFSLGMMLRFYDVMPAVVLIALVIYAVVCMGTSRSLELLRSIEPISLTSAIENSNQRESEVGWPFNRLNRRSEVHLDRYEAICVTLLFAWWLYVLQRLLVLGPDDVSVSTFVRILYWFPLWLMILGRLLIYCLYHRPPISLVGRIGTGRIIIPGYDKVFVAPLSALALSIGIPVVLLSLGMLRYHAYPIAALPTMCLILNGGPSFHRWRLTGQHRIVPALTTSKLHEKL